MDKRAFGSLPRRPLNEVRDQARNVASMVKAFVEPRERQLSYLRSEAIEVGRKVVDCYVVQTRRVPQAASAILWIDKLRLVIVRSDSTSQLENGEAVSSTTIFHTTKLTEPIPDDVFTFTPPPSAEARQSIAVTDCFHLTRRCMEVLPTFACVNS